MLFQSAGSWGASHYAMTNYEEYFAEGVSTVTTVQCSFNFQRIRESEETTCTVLKEPTKSKIRLLLHRCRAILTQTRLLQVIQHNPKIFNDCKNTDSDYTAIERIMSIYIAIRPPKLYKNLLHKFS